MNATDTTPRLLLPFIMPSQAQKHVTHNEAIARLDRFAHPAVATRAVAVPPADADEGTAFLVPAGAIGGWLGHDGDIAVPAGGDWEFLPPFVGLKLFVEDEKLFVYFDGAEWLLFADGLASSPATLGINAEADDMTRLRVASDSVAFSHDPASTGDARVVLNKAATERTASLLFQKGWAGRAEIGLTGSDALSVKTSADGETWRTGAVFKADGAMRAPQSITVGDEVEPAGAVTIATASPILSLRDTAGTGNSHLGIVNWVDANGEEKVWCGLGSSGNNAFTFLSHYSDGIEFYAFGGNHPVIFRQGGDIRINVHTNGYVGIREAAPTAPLHVAGAMRVGGVDKASLPSPAAMGAGAIIFVSDDAAGATLAFSDGAAWLRVHDRQPVA